MTRPARRPLNWGEVHERRERLQEAVDRAWKPDAEERLRILKARARALARRSPDSLAAGTPLEIIEFVLSGEHYGIESKFVGEVFPLTGLTRLHCVPPFLLGIVNLRGEIISVVDLRRFFDLPDHGLTDLNKVLLLQGDHMVFGVLADRVDGVRAVGHRQLQPDLPTLTDRRRDYLKGIAEGRIVVLDGASLLADTRLVVEETVEE